MYGILLPHSMLEEDSRYPRNALGTRTATYWLPKRLGIPSCTARNFGNPKVLTGTLLAVVIDKYLPPTFYQKGGNKQ
jgi:hypothetical protein